VIGAVSNLDNLGVGVALGMRGTRIGATANLIVAGTTMAATAAAVTCGHLLSNLIPSAIGVATACTWAQTPRPPGCARAPWRPSRHPRHVDRVVSWREAIALGVALSMNNLGTGLGAGVSGMPALATTVSAGLLSLACVGGGSDVGRSLGRLMLGRHAPLVAGMLLLAVGAAMLSGLR
jgi:putative Mn2+ efflux pump MntP